MWYKKQYVLWAIQRKFEPKKMMVSLIQWRIMIQWQNSSKRCEMPYLTQLKTHLLYHPVILTSPTTTRKIVPPEVLIVKSLHGTTIIGAQIKFFCLTLPFKLPELKPMERFRMVSTSACFCTTLLCQVRVKVDAVKKFETSCLFCTCLRSATCLAVVFVCWCGS